MSGRKPPSVWSSAAVFTRGVFRRWYYWLFAFALDPLDFGERLGWRSLEIPPVIGWIVIAALFAWAGVLTFHEERKKRWGYESARVLIALCGRLIDEAPDMTAAWLKDHGEFVPDVSDDLRREIESWTERVGSELDHVGEFGRLKAELKGTPRNDEYWYMNRVKTSINNYMKSLGRQGPGGEEWL